jgi:two-component system, chemotaxis family, protein-glutamate methylesterase/glutaminase
LAATASPLGNRDSTRRIRVLIVDDSALVRQILTEMLTRDPGIEVVGTAGDAHIAREKIKQLDPDVLTLDVEMPKMDGLTFLRNLMRLRPMPVVMVSSLAEHGAEVTLDALALGAVDYLPKPRIDIAAKLPDYCEELIEKVKCAAGASVRALDSRLEPSLATPRRLLSGARPASDRVIGIGASTGGTEAIKQVLAGLPPDSPGIVIAQHIPKAFSTAFARRLNDSCALQVCEAEDGQQILAGHAYLAPGDRHLCLARDGSRYICRIDDSEPVNRHKPSVDVLFRSLAQNAGRNAVALLLTGMGKDGARGMLDIRRAGGRTLAQDEASSVVWGMPGEAVSLGAAQHIVPLEHMAEAVRELAAIPEARPGAGSA